MGEDIEEIHSLALALAEARAKKKSIEEELKSINEQIKDIEEDKLSSLLDNLSVNKLSLDDMDISKSVVFRCPYTKHTDKSAFKFLFDSDNDGALKKQLIIDIEAYPRVPFLLNMENIEYKIEYSIHHATLSSIIKELVEAGKFTMEDIDKYSIYIQPQVKVKEK